VSRMEYILASNNAHKAAELSAILQGLPIITMKQAGFALEIEENGTTFRENALCKARAVKAAMNVCSCGPKDRAVLADDSGLMVDALDGAPGIYSARYAGEGATDAMRIEKLLRALNGVPEEKRTAQFVCCIACILPSGETFAVEGVCPGRITFAPAGRDGFGYDPVFFVPEAGCTFAELSGDGKNALSHRGRACKALLDALKTRRLLG